MTRPEPGASARDGNPLPGVAVSLALSAAAGFVDAIGWLALDHVFIAQMSGNAVLAAVHLAAGESDAAILHAFTIGMFLLGLLTASIAMEIGIRAGARRVLAIAMAIELLLLGAFAAGADVLLPPGADARSAGGRLYLLVALAAMAMGAQNTSLSMAGILEVYTTHVTGTLTRLSQDATALGAALVGQLAGGGRDRRREQAAPGARAPRAGFHALWRSLGLILAFFAGAVLAARLVRQWTLGEALLLPLAVVMLVGVLDLVRPLAGDGPDRKRPARH